jgi:hypothetical protein
MSSEENKAETAEPITIRVRDQVSKKKELKDRRITELKAKHCLLQRVFGDTTLKPLFVCILFLLLTQ